MPESNTVPKKFIPVDYQVCSKTVMDNIADPDISFDKDGVSNYYYQYFKNLPLPIADKSFAEQELKKIKDKISVRCI